MIKICKKNSIKLYFQLNLLILVFIFTACVSLPEYTKKTASRKIIDKGIFTATELANFFIANNNNVDFYDIKSFAQLYIEEAAMENINSDVAFAQMCLETGFLTFGNLVTADMHNYCGLGAMDAAHPGERFATPQLGVRAHIQHLQAYGTTVDISLNNELVDPRYSWVHKTKYIETIDQLAGTWAMDQDYGTKLENILLRLEQHIN